MLVEDGREHADAVEADESYFGDLWAQFDALDAAIEALLAGYATTAAEAAETPPADTSLRGGLIGLIGRYSYRGSAEVEQQAPAPAALETAPASQPAALEPDWL